MNNYLINKPNNMNRFYITPQITVIEIESASVIAISGGNSYRTTSISTTSATNEVNVTYDGINHTGIGNGGFLDVK